MNVWVDADSCPAAIKEILFRAAERKKIKLTLVANQFMQIPTSAYITFLKVASGLDVADNEIVKRLNPGDLVITNDIPLAAEVVGQGGFALNVRGELFSVENVGDRLSMRDFMDSLRASGQETGGPKPMSSKDRAIFANQLDTFLTRHAKDT
ncbi:MAG: YaiI/YqxD family protein [Desulfobacterales bacterium]|nr:YaiI/YqxD family protein [Deltaproteobacteria bacterium]NNK96307.1 YaiI/YqxD family protein [Desulfobacterales bacterium]